MHQEVRAALQVPARDRTTPARLAEPSGHGLSSTVMKVVSGRMTSNKSACLPRMLRQTATAASSKSASHTLASRFKASTLPLSATRREGLARPTMVALEPLVGLKRCPFVTWNTLVHCLGNGKSRGQQQLGGPTGPLIPQFGNIVSLTMLRTAPFQCKSMRVQVRLPSSSAPLRAPKPAERLTSPMKCASLSKFALRQVTDCEDHPSGLVVVLCSKSPCLCCRPAWHLERLGHRGDGRL